MLVTEQYYCDFVAWASMGDIPAERILFAKNFMELQLERQRGSFGLLWFQNSWQNGMAIRQSTTLPQPNMPAAVDHDLSSEDEEDDETWCYCKTVKGGATMIGCENINCQL